MSIGRQASGLPEANMRISMSRAILSARSHKGLDVMAILAAHPAGMTLTEMAARPG